jgi:hypothetical protein
MFCVCGVCALLILTEFPSKHLFMMDSSSHYCSSNNNHQFVGIDLRARARERECMRRKTQEKILPTPAFLLPAGMVGVTDK